MQKRFFFPLNFYFLSLVSERSTKSACVHGSCSCSCLCFIILFYVSSNGIFVLLCMPNHCSMNRMPFVTSFLIHFVCIHIQLDSVFVSLSLSLFPFYRTFLSFKFKNISSILIIVGIVCCVSERIKNEVIIHGF